MDTTTIAIIAAVLLIGFLLWTLPFKAFLVLLPTAYCGYIAVQSVAMDGGKADNFTLGFGAVAAAGAAIVYALAKNKSGKSSGKKRAKAAVNA